MKKELKGKIYTVIKILIIGVIIGATIKVFGIIIGILIAILGIIGKLIGVNYGIL